MLTDVDLTETFDKKEYKAEIERLGKELAALQRELIRRRIPTIIAVEGFSAAGKATLISKIVYTLDPRHFKVRTMGKVTESAFHRPFLWGYWTRLPADGDMVIFDKSWGRAAISGSGIAHGMKLGEQAHREAYSDINAFERQLRDSGMLVIKLFLHISRDEQYRRFKELEGNPATAWRVDYGDYEQNRNFEDYLRRFDKMLENTGETSASGGSGRWHVIAAEDRRYATVTAFGIIIDEIKSVLARENASGGTILQANGAPSILSRVIQRGVSNEIYKEKLNYYQSRMTELGFKMYSNRRAVAIVYEGWDASGKGGNIKRLTEELDPRGYEVVTIAAPTGDELAHHYLWRFYNRLPKDGHLAIFDRSWYGRVLVERVEGYATAKEWQRAYREINEMEWHWANHGVLLFKFWMHIDKDEQLRRFEARQQNPAKQYKITDEDWRNREKWEQYEAAANEMFARTDTDYAPWDIVPANDKKFARLYVLERVVSRLEKILGDNHGET